jgi:hypothetical protein
MWEPVSASRALRISLARSTPGGVPRASFRNRSASSERRFLRGVELFETTPFLHGALRSMEGGSAIGVLSTEKYQGPLGDAY